jgi:hypothetical protein
MRSYAGTVVILCGVSQAGCGASRDADVIAATLEHFTARGDTMPWHKTGVTLIAAQTQKFVPGMGRDSAKCHVPQDLYDRFVARNAAALPATPLVSSSKAWRLIRPDEMEGDPPAYRVQVTNQTAEGEPVKTLVHLSVPAYSDSGDTAFLKLHFTWSIHGAVAEYSMKSVGNDWKVECSDLLFYV